MAEPNSVHPGAHHMSPGLYGFNILSAVVGLLQSTKLGSGSIEEKIICLSVSFSILAFVASEALPPRYTTILCRISFFFSVLACSFLLSPFAPHVLFWVPHLPCVFPLLHLLQLLPAPLRQSLQQPWLSTWNAVRDAACWVHQDLPWLSAWNAVRNAACWVPQALPWLSTWNAVRDAACWVHRALLKISGKDGVPERSTSSSSAAPDRSIEEGDAHAVNGNNNNNE